MHSAAKPARWLYDHPYVLMMFPGLIWGGNIALGRYVADHIPPVALAQMRWVLAAALLAPFAWRHVRTDWPAIRRDWKLIVLLSVTGISIYNTLVYVGLHETSAINAGLLQSFQPIVIALFGLAIYRDRLTAPQTLGIAISSVGVVAILARGDPARLSSFSFNAGDLWVLSAILAYSLYTVLLKSRPATHPLSLLFVLMGLGALLLAPATAYEALVLGAVPRFDGLTIAAVAYVAIFASLLAYFCYNRGVQLLGANRAGPFLHLVPLFGSVFAIGFLGEALHWYHAAGWLLIIGGIAIAQRTARPAARSR